MSAPTPTPTPTPGIRGPLYRRLWRWHFYAAFLVIPFVLMQSLTGTLYLWHEEWTDWAHADLRFVQPATSRVSLEAQLAAAAALHAHAQPGSLLISVDPRRSTQVLFGGHHGEGDALPFPVFVDPYSGRVLGDLPAWSWMPGWSRKIHGGWPLGDAGSWLLELGACWAVVMILSGLYLWWAGAGPDRRGARGRLRSLWPRLDRGMRGFVRDLHGSVAVLFSIIILAFLFTALPWTHFWGGQVLRPVQQALGQPSPFADTLRAKSTPLPANAQPMSLDAAVDAARSAGMVGDLEVKLDGGTGSALVVRNRLPRAADEIAIAFDRSTHAPLVTTTWADYPPVPRAVATGVDLHEGHFFGRANQWFNTIVAAALVWMSLTGLLSWWLRRPRGRLGAPLRTQTRLPPAALAMGAVLCVLLPLLGASVLLLWLLDAAVMWQRARRVAF